MSALGDDSHCADDPKVQLIHLVHDWADGKCAKARVTAQFPQLVDSEPRTQMCYLAFYWVRRLVESDESFLEILVALCRSRYALVRVHAAFNFEFSKGETVFSGFKALLNDRSVRVREQIVQTAEIRRWSEAVGAINERIEIEPKTDIRDQMRAATKMIGDGYRYDPKSPKRIWVYSGDGPGGSGAVSCISTEDYPQEIIEHVNRVERRFLESGGALPIRPKGYAYRPSILLDWTPNQPARPHNPRS